jgi:hypothetical protein
MFCVNFWNSLSFCCFRFLQYIFNISNIFGCCFIIFCLFRLCFYSSLQFRSYRFACYSRNYHRSFVFACFLVFIASWVIYTYLDCAAKIGSIWYWFQFCKNHKKVRREVWACEDIKSVWVKHERCEDLYFFTTNQFLQVLSCQITRTHHPFPM